MPDIRPVVFSRFEHVPQATVPAVGIFSTAGLTVAASGPNGLEVANALRRADPAHRTPRGFIKPLMHAQLLHLLASASQLEPEYFRKRSMRIEPRGRYAKLIAQGMDPLEAECQSQTDILDGLFFNVGGPITTIQSGGRDVSFVIPGDWIR